MLNCPKCLKYFPTAEGVMRHRSQPLTACNGWDTVVVSAAASSDDSDKGDPVPSFPPSSPFQPVVFDPNPGSEPHDQDGNFNHPQEPQVDHPKFVSPVPSVRTDFQGHVVVAFDNAAHIYDLGETFLNQFDLDPYSHLRRDNLFYPFANLDDWKMANFLLTSKLSIRALNNFLSLKAASFNLIIQICINTRPSRHRRCRCLSGQQKTCVPRQKFFHQVPIGISKSYPQCILQRNVSLYIFTMLSTVLSYFSTIHSLRIKWISHCFVYSRQPSRS
jgi:hypothetical protein